MKLIMTYYKKMIITYKKLFVVVTCDYGGSDREQPFDSVWNALFGRQYLTGEQSWTERTSFLPHSPHFYHVWGLIPGWKLDGICCWIS